MDSVLQSLPHSPEWTLREAILEPKATSNIMDPTQSQPTCTAIQVALVILLESWGIVASAVLGAIVQTSLWFGLMGVLLFGAAGNWQWAQACEQRQTSKG